MAKLIIYPTPLNALCQLQHDSGYSIDGVADSDANGRQCQSFEVKEGTPNGWGARLVITSPKKVSLMQRGVLFYRDDIKHWVLYADDFILQDEKVCPPCPEPPIPPNPPSVPTDPLGIIQWTYNHNGPFNLATKEGCGKFTEACCTNLHEYHQTSWGHIRKVPPQNQYNGHAVDAVQLLLDDFDGTKSGIYDIITSSESSEARPAFNYSGPARNDLWYYPA